MKLIGRTWRADNGCTETPEVYRLAFQMFPNFPFVKNDRLKNEKTLDSDLSDTLSPLVLAC